MISQLVLRNFKCFEYQPIPLGSITLLAGLNGMGKSSVLQALLLLRQSYLDGLLPDTGLELNGSLVQMGNARDVFYEGAQTDEFEIGVSWRDGAAARVVLHYDREADVMRIAPAAIARELFTRAPFTDQFHYIQAERLGPRVTNALSEYQVYEHRQLGTSGQYAQHFLVAHGRDHVPAPLRHPRCDDLQLSRQVQAWLQELSPGVELNLNVQQEMDTVQLRYAFVGAHERSATYRATAVGFGITYALPVLVAVLSSAPGGMVLIENPEAHLHPQGQFRVGELLACAAAAGIQVVAETHSDHVLNGLRVAVHDGLLAPGDAAIHFFSRVEESGRVHSRVVSPLIDHDGRLDQWPDGFFDEWDKSLEKLLAPRR